MYLATQRAKDLGKQCGGWKSSSTVKVGQQMKDWLYISYKCLPASRPGISFLAHSLSDITLHLGHSL